VAGFVQLPAKAKVLELTKTEVITVESDDEGIALALSMCEPGESVILHEGGCNVESNGDGCDCQCTTLTPGAKA
jgi:hypothetical protein